MSTERSDMMLLEFQSGLKWVPKPPSGRRILLEQEQKAAQDYLDEQEATDREAYERLISPDKRSNTCRTGQFQFTPIDSSKFLSLSSERLKNGKHETVEISGTPRMSPPLKKLRLPTPMYKRKVVDLPMTTTETILPPSQRTSFGPAAVMPENTAADVPKTNAIASEIVPKMPEGQSKKPSETEYEVDMGSVLRALDREFDVAIETSEVEDDLFADTGKQKKTVTHKSLRSIVVTEV